MKNQEGPWYYKSMEAGTRVARTGHPTMTGTIHKIVDEEHALVQWDDRIPFVSDHRLPITLVHVDFLEELHI